MLTIADVGVTIPSYLRAVCDEKGITLSDDGEMTRRV